MATYIVEGACRYVEQPPTPYEQLSNRISSVENDMRQIDDILGEEEIPNVETEDIEENESDV